MSKREPIRVLIVDDHREMTKGIEATLNVNEDIIVVDTLNRLPDPRNTGLRFDLCVLDLMGVATAEEITVFVAQAPSLIYSMEGRWQQRFAAWVFGWQPPRSALAQHEVTEEQYAADLAVLRRQCADAGLGRLEVWEPGSPWAAVTVSAGAVPLPQVHLLSPREQQVLECRADGARISEIAAELGISTHTVESQLKHAMARFGFATTASETHLLFAIYVMGRHHHPDRLRRQLLKLRRTQPAAPPSRPFLEL